jgi:hypothetical protein
VTDIEKGVLLQGDGWGVSFAALAIHRRDLTDGRLLASTRLRHQQARCSELQAETILVATDSRLFRLHRESLQVVHDWSTRVPRYTDAMVSEGHLVFMANWLRPIARVLDLDTGRTRGLRIGNGIAILDRVQPMLGMALHDGTIHEIDIVNARQRIVARTGPGRQALLFARRWLWVLDGRWETRQGVLQPPDASSTLSLWDLQSGQRLDDIRLEDPAIRIAGDVVLGELWAACQAPGVWVPPTRIVRIDARTGKAVDTFHGPARSQVAGLHPSEGLAFVTEYERSDEATLSCLRFQA